MRIPQLLLVYSLILAITLVMLVGASTMMPLWAHYTQSLGGNLKTAGMAIMCYFLGTGGASLLFSFIVERYPYYAFYLIGMAVVAGLCLFSLAFIHSLSLLYLAEIILGIAVGVISTVSAAILGIIMSPRYSMMGWAVFTFVTYLSVGGGAILGSHLVHYYSYSILFFVSAMIMSAACVLSIAIHFKRRAMNLSNAVNTGAKGGAADFFKKTHVYGLLLGVTLLFLALNMITPLWSAYVAHLGGGLKAAGFAVGTYFWSYAIFNLLFGLLGQRYKIPKVYIVLSYLLTALVFLGYLFIHTPGELYVLQAVLAFAASMQSPAFDDTYAKQLTPAQQVFGQGFYMAFYYISWALGSFVGSHLAASFSFDTVFISMASVAFAGFVVMLFTFMFYRQQFSLSAEG
jgi:MFS family permease